MSYVKISDPAVIDLAAWHQVISVVNQHSDTITAITNNFGAKGSGTTDYSSDLYAHEFNSASQKILFGRASAYNSVSGHTTTSSSGPDWYATVSFVDSTAGTTGFSGLPVVTATVWSGNASPGSVSQANHDIIISVFNVGLTSFSYRLYRSISVTNTSNVTTTAVPITGTVYINWTAIGPR
jgi:hypothetical protein